MPAKVCPRCNAYYGSLKSKTCPQCFAILDVIDDTAAQQLTAAQAQIEQTPEYQEAKAVDDERFREQSFGACLGVVGITLATFILIVFVLVTGAHHHHSPRSVALTPGIASGAVDTPDPLTVLPVAAAALDDVMPPAIGPYRRLTRDQTVTLTGTLTPIFHAEYAISGMPALTVYAVPTSLPTTQEDQFRQSLVLALQLGGAPGRAPLFFATQYWRYAAIAPPGQNPAAFREALAAQFKT